jgi:hypothetical protein
MKAKTSREHYEKFAEVVQKIGVEKLLPFVPWQDRLEAYFMQDPHLNNVPLPLWDGIKQGLCIRSWVTFDGMAAHVRQHPVAKLAFAAGYKSWSCSDIVCTLKHVAIYHVIKAQPEFDDVL